MTESEIEEIVTAAMKLHGETSDSFSYRDIVERVGPEIAERATAAERERLMVLVCSRCGRKRGDDEVPPCPSCRACRFVALAEFLRLHPEAGEGG